MAACLGITPRAVRKSLQDVTPAGIHVVHGNEAAGWAPGQLPESLRNRLAEEASRRQYASLEALLAAAPKRWEPPLPMSQICEADWNYARKLRSAMQALLIGQHDTSLSGADFEAKGVAAYASRFGHRISARYWRELFMRVLRRDGGSGDWGRLEIYLPASPKPKETPARLVSDAIVEGFGELESFILACTNPASPSEIEKRGIWTMALEKYASMVESRTPAKRAARRVRSFLHVKAPFLAPTRDALRKAFYRNLDALEKAGGDPCSLRDGREANGERFKIPEEDRDHLIHQAVFYYRGDVAKAWRDLLKGGFSEAIRQRYAGKASRKSHVPTSVMKSVSSEVAILAVIYQGKRAFDSIKGHVDRTYEGIPSRICDSADDFTMPVYFHVPDGEGWFNLTRGQILIFIDFRTLRVLGWSLQPDRNYSSLTIRSLCTHVFLEHGIPKVLQFERGIWKSSTLVTGHDRAALEFTEVVQGLREFGIRFIHSIRARSKTVERVGGLLQDLMEHEPGYCGRDERKDAPESLRKQMAEVKARKVHPSAYFYGYHEWERRFGEIVDQYNATEQQGKILRGLSPDSAYTELADPDDPPMEFGAGLRYLLAHHKEQKLVTLNGVTFTIGKKRFNYRGKEIAHLVGHEVLAWFDPENPQMIVVTDLKRRNPICVSRSNQPSALECLVDPDSGTLARELKRAEDQASHMKTRFHALKSKFPMPRRQTIVDAGTLELGQKIDRQKKTIQARMAEDSARRMALDRKAAKLGITVLNTRLVDGDEGARMMLEAQQEMERESGGAIDGGEAPPVNV